jgi:uncharacterized membrane protein YwzB
MTNWFVPIIVFILCLIFTWWAGNWLEQHEKMVGEKQVQPSREKAKR